MPDIDEAPPKRQRRRSGPKTSRQAAQPPQPTVADRISPLLLSERTCAAALDEDEFLPLYRAARRELDFKPDFRGNREDAVQNAMLEPFIGDTVKHPAAYVKSVARNQLYKLDKADAAEM